MASLNVAKNVLDSLMPKYSEKDFSVQLQNLHKCMYAHAQWEFEGVHCCRWAKQSKIGVLINIFISDNEYHTAGATKTSTSLTVVSCIVVSMTAPDSKHFFFSHFLTSIGTPACTVENLCCWQEAQTNAHTKKTTQPLSFSVSESHFF